MIGAVVDHGWVEVRFGLRHRRHLGCRLLRRLDHAGLAPQCGLSDQVVVFAAQLVLPRALRRDRGRGLYRSAPGNSSISNQSRADGKPIAQPAQEFQAAGE